MREVLQKQTGSAGDRMDWNEEKQTRFDKLRQRQLTGTLTVDEQTELAEMAAMLEQEEARYLEPAIASLELEQAVTRERLQKLQADNEELAKLLHQQEQLAVEARRWLADFQQRHENIQAIYTQLTGEVLTVA